MAAITKNYLYFKIVRHGQNLSDFHLNLFSKSSNSFWEDLKISLVNLWLAFLIQSLSQSLLEQVLEQIDIFAGHKQIHRRAGFFENLGAVFINSNQAAMVKTL